MTEAVWIALASAVPATIAAFSSLRNGQKANEIHVLVNSKMTKALADLGDANSRVTALEQRVAQLLEQAPGTKIEERN